MGWLFWINLLLVCTESLVFWFFVNDQNNSWMCIVCCVNLKNKYIQKETHEELLYTTEQQSDRLQFMKRKLYFFLYSMVHNMYGILPYGIYSNATWNIIVNVITMSHDFSNKLWSFYYVINSAAIVFTNTSQNKASSITLRTQSQSHQSILLTWNTSSDHEVNIYVQVHNYIFFFPIWHFCSSSTMCISPNNVQHVNHVGTVK